MHPIAIIIHYMDGILFAVETQEQVNELFTSAQKILPQDGLGIASEKIQKEESYMYLGYILERTHVKPQKISIWRDTLKTLNDFQ
jgi:uncharacterized protein YjfI (DUF2170 family)